MPKCLDCKSEDKQKYYLIPGTNTYLCVECYSISKPVRQSVEEPKHLPMFTRWKCRKHECGSYNFNQLLRHEMPWCDIVLEITAGVVKPKTFGGYNGNLNRHYFPDWQEYARRDDMDKHALKAWDKFVAKKHLEYNIRRKKTNPFKTRDPHVSFTKSRVLQVT